jgi:hypothetical protein
MPAPMCHAKALVISILIILLKLWPVRADQQHNIVMLGASKGKAIWVDATKDVLLLEPTSLHTRWPVYPQRGDLLGSF